MNSTVQSESQPCVWLISVDEKTWGYVSSSDEVAKIFKYLSEKFINDITQVNPTFKVEAITVDDNTIKIKCHRLGYVYNTSWTAHIIHAIKVVMYSPNDNVDDKMVLLPFPEGEGEVKELKLESIQTTNEKEMCKEETNQPECEKLHTESKPIDIPSKKADETLDELEKKMSTSKSPSKSPKKRQRALPIELSESPAVEPVKVMLNQPINQKPQPQLLYNLRKYPINRSKKK